MLKEDYIEVSKHINILNVAYHLCLEIIEINGKEIKAVCPFCGYNKNTKIATLILDSNNNKYFCSRCNVNGLSIGLYAKCKNIDVKKAYKELLDRECFSEKRSKIKISPINEIADINKRNEVYKEFLNMLRLENSSKSKLTNLGFLNTTIDEQMYKTVPTNYIYRRLIAHRLSKKYDLSGIPGFYQEEDFKWNFTSTKGIFVPIFDDTNKIQALSIHLDKEFKNSTDIWFSSKDKINGTGINNLLSKNKIDSNTKTAVITDNFLLGNYIKASIDIPFIAFQNINNSYQILKAIENTNIENIIFAFTSDYNENLNYIMNRIFRNLLPLGYNLSIKIIADFSEVLEDDFMKLYTIEKPA